MHSLAIVCLLLRIERVRWAPRRRIHLRLGVALAEEVLKTFSLEQCLLEVHLI